jgi:hypothetical protein
MNAWPDGPDTNSSDGLDDMERARKARMLDECVRQAGISRRQARIAKRSDVANYLFSLARYYEGEAAKMREQGACGLIDGTIDR